MPDDVTSLLREHHEHPYEVTSMRFAKDVLSSFTEVAEHIEGIMIMQTDHDFFTLKDHSLSIIVSRGDRFPYPGPEGYCKVYNILWKKRSLATITMKVGCWRSSAIVRIMHRNIAWRDTVQHLESWKLLATTQRPPCSSVALVQNTWKMSDDAFFHMTEFL